MNNYNATWTKQLLGITMAKKDKESCSNWSFNISFFIWKEGPDNINNFTESFPHIVKLWVLSFVLNSEDFSS